MINGKLKGMMFERVKAEYDASGKRKLVPTGEPDIFVEFRLFDAATVVL